jgi:DNA-binding LacI/PurR family transcriptional regulator
MKKIRIEDVANEAGVSVTAVSFAFNKPSRLNAKTVARILEVAERLGYTPNPHARALLAKSLGVIGVLTPQSLPTIFTNPFYTAFHEGVGRVCEENNLSLTVISPASSSLSEVSARAPVDGLIVVGLNENHPEIEILHRRQMPFIIVDGDSTTAPSVNIDDEDGAWQAANYLLEQGHQKIACLTFEFDMNSTHNPKVYGVGERRLLGFKRAFAERGIVWDEEHLYDTGAGLEEGAKAFQRLWEYPANRPSAIVSFADISAIGALQAALKAGVRVPEDIAIIGYDDIPEAIWTRPALSTIHQPMVEKGEISAQLLLALIAGEAIPQSHFVLPTELVIRGTT